MDFLSDENLKKYKFSSIPDEDIQKRSDEKDQLTSFAKSKSRIGFRETKPQSGYLTKDEMMSIEQLDSLALFMRNNQLNNSENYPFYNNYDENNIGIHRHIIYQAILGGNKYNATNIGIDKDGSETSEKIKAETFQEELNRKMKQISRSKGNIEIPNSLDMIGSTKASNNRGYGNQNTADVEFQNDISQFYEEDQYIQENNEDFVASLVEPFTEDDYDLARINNKIFDDNCWYKKDYRMNAVDDPQLLQEKRQYFENKRIVKRSNKEHLIYFIHSEIVYNEVIGLMPHKDNREILLNERKYGGNSLIKGEVCSGHVLNSLYKIDVEREQFKQYKLELQLENFSQLHLKASEQILICGGKANGIAQSVLMLIDYNLQKYQIKSGLRQARSDSLLLQIDEFVYIISGTGSLGECLLTCEKYNIITQQVTSIQPLSLQKQSLCGTVSDMNKCIYVAGTPLILDGYIQLQKYEPHTNFWSVISISINYLPLKQPKSIKMAIYDESQQKSQLYIYCQDLNKYENYCLSLHDLTGDDTRSPRKAGKRKNIQNINDPSAYNLSTINSAESLINIYSSTTTKNLTQQNPVNLVGSATPNPYTSPVKNRMYPKNQKQQQDILIEDQMESLDLSVIAPDKRNVNRQTKSQNQRPKMRIDSPKLEPIQYIPQFNEQYKQIFKNRKKYFDSLKKKEEYEKNLMIESLIGETEVDEDTQQLINTNPNPPPLLKIPNSYRDNAQNPRVRSNSKLALSPQSQNRFNTTAQANQVEQTPSGQTFAKSLFFSEQLKGLDTPKKASYSPQISSKRKPLLTKKQQEQQQKQLLQQQQAKLLVEQQEQLKKRGQIVRIEQTRSDFNHLEILATRDFDVFTINKNNPLEVERFDFITWQKQQINLRYSPLL